MPFTFQVDSHKLFGKLFSFVPPFDALALLLTSLVPGGELTVDLTAVLRVTIFVTKLVPIGVVVFGILDEEALEFLAGTEAFTFVSFLSNCA